MRKMMKKAIALSLIATMSMSAATIVHAEDEVTLRVLNWGNTDEEKIANDAIARFNEENPNVKVDRLVYRLSHGQTLFRNGLPCVLQEKLRR